MTANLSSSAPPHKRNFNGFSLIEMLAVVAILIVLLALAVPVYRMVASSGDTAKSTSNLRQIGLAALQFSRDHDGRLPPSRHWGFYTSTSTPRGIIDYLGLDLQGTPASRARVTVLTCPAQHKTYPSQAPFFRTYSANGYALSWEDDAASPPTGAPLRVVNIASPSKMMFAMNGRLGNVPSTQGDAGDYSNFLYNTHLTGGNISGIFTHKGRAAAVFMDGHVELLSPDEIPPSSYSPFWGRRND